jgi:hypothetical protein
VTGRFDGRRHDATFWEPRLAELAPDLSKPALAVARQRLVQWCAQNGGGLTAAELRAYLEDVQSVLAQAGIRQGVVRRPLPTRGADESPSSRPRLRVIK